MMHEVSEDAPAGILELLKLFVRDLYVDLENLEFGNFQAFCVWET